MNATTANTAENLMGRHCLANGLVGFSSSTLRVFVCDIRGEYAWVVTASLSDSGTRLVLDLSQLEAFQAMPGAMVHKTGLVTLEGGAK